MSKPQTEMNTAILDGEVPERRGENGGRHARRESRSLEQTVI